MIKTKPIFRKPFRNNNPKLKLLCKTKMAFITSYNLPIKLNYLQGNLQIQAYFERLRIDLKGYCPYNPSRYLNNLGSGFIYTIQRIGGTMFINR